MLFGYSYLPLNPGVFAVFKGVDSRTNALNGEVLKAGRLLNFESSLSMISILDVHLHILISSSQELLRINVGIEFSFSVCRNQTPLRENSLDNMPMNVS